jgi:hypothetical protein
LIFEFLFSDIPKRIYSNLQLDVTVEEEVIVIDETGSSCSGESTSTTERIHPRTNEKKILNVQHEKEPQPADEEEPAVIFVSDDPNDAKAEGEEVDADADMDSEQDDPTGDILYTLFFS